MNIYLYLFVLNILCEYSISKNSIRLPIAVEYSHYSSSGSGTTLHSLTQRVWKVMLDFGLVPCILVNILYCRLIDKGGASWPMGGLCPSLSRHNNNNKSMFMRWHYGTGIARVHLVQSKGVKQRRASADLWTKPTELGRKSVSRQLVKTASIIAIFIIITEPESWYLLYTLVV